jgi:hypothetical protein
MELIFRLFRQYKGSMGFIYQYVDKYLAQIFQFLTPQRPFAFPKCYIHWAYAMTQYSKDALAGSGILIFFPLAYNPILALQ